MLVSPVSECSTCSNTCCQCCLKCAAINPDIPTFYWAPDREKIKKYVADYIALRNMDGMAPGWAMGSLSLRQYGIDSDLWTEAVCSLLEDGEITMLPAGGGYLRVGYEDWVGGTMQTKS